MLWIRDRNEFKIFKIKGYIKGSVGPIYCMFVFGDPHFQFNDVAQDVVMIGIIDL